MRFGDLPPSATGRTHLAIFTEPYLGLLFQGKKTVESRWSKHQIAPWYRLSQYDRVYVKKSGGPVVGQFHIDWFRHLYIQGFATREYQALIKSHQAALCVDDDFLQENFRDKLYCTLIGVTKLEKLAAPIEIESCGRHGWISREEEGVS